MGSVEDVRQIIQDFLAPELRALVARMDSLEKVMDARFTAVDTKFVALDQKIQALDQKIDARADITNAKLDHLIESLAVDRRLAKLEAQQPSVPQ